MPKRFATLALTGLIGLAAGAGIGVAAAETGRGELRPNESAPMLDQAAMDTMHDAMRDQMPADLAQQCDDMHRIMGDEMDPGQMGSMMGGPTVDQHRTHHR
jgi:hypothetical protein